MSLRIITAGAALLVLAPSANASFTGFAYNETWVSQDTRIVDVYATFSSTDDILVAIWDADVDLTVPYPALVHNDFASGTWMPQFTSDAVDSFVTIGGDPTPVNGTYPGPEWFDLWNRSPHSLDIPAGASWFNSNELNLQGKAQVVFLYTSAGCLAYSGPATRLMRIAYHPGLVTTLAISAGVTSNHGPDTISEDGYDFHLAYLATAGWSLCDGEFTGDQFVGADDLGLLLSNWGAPGVGDIDNSGAVDAGDLGVLLGNWGFCGFVSTCD